MNDRAMIYEHIIRKANDGCPRYGTAGADADIFRKLDRVFSIDFDGKNNHTEFEKGLALGEVSSFLRDAFERMSKNEKYTKQEQELFREYSNELLTPSLESVDNVLDRIAEDNRFPDLCS